MAFSMLVATIVSATAEPAFFDSNAFGSGPLGSLRFFEVIPMLHSVALSEKNH